MFSIKTIYLIITAIQRNFVSSQLFAKVCKVGDVFEKGNVNKHVLLKKKFFFMTTIWKETKVHNYNETV